MSIYLDYNATTPLDARVVAAMLPYLQDYFANPSSVHAPGRAARAAVEAAREQVADLVGAHPSQVIFTSGGTEANNLALQGLAASLPRGRLAISAVEHASVRAPAAAVAARGWGLDQIGVDELGRVTSTSLTEALSDETRLVSVMLANNETGVVQDVAMVAAAARRFGALVHTDAVQAAGKIPVDFTACGAQLMSLSAHKIYGPKGVGALIIDKSVDLQPLMHGGGQERGLRGGTEHVAGIVGFGKAAELARAELGVRRVHLMALRERLEQRLQAEVPSAVLIAAEAERLPNTVMLSLPAIDGETLVMALDGAGIAISSGSACSSGSTDASPVLLAMGLSGAVGRGAVRLSLGKDSTSTDVEAVVAALRAQHEMAQKWAVTAWE